MRNFKLNRFSLAFFPLVDERFSPAQTKFYGVGIDIHGMAIDLPESVSEGIAKSSQK